MLENQKKILLGAAKNPYLFRKEIIKMCDILSYEESKELYQWVKKEFGPYYSQILNEVLCRVSA